MKRLIWIFCAAVLIVPALHLYSIAAQAPPLVAQPPLLLPRAPGRFDYLEFDARLHRLLVAHTGSRTFDVINAASGNPDRQVQLGEAHGIAVDVKDGKYFVGVSRGGPVGSSLPAGPGIGVVNRKNLVLTNYLRLDGPIDAVTFDSKRGVVYADRVDNGQIVAINGKTDKLAGTIMIGGDLEYLAYDAVSDRIYQNIVTPASVAVIDPSTKTVIAKWPAAPATEVTGLAVDSAAKKVFSAGSNGKLVMLDMTSGAVIASADIATDVDQIAFDPGKRRIYCASATGQISVVQETDSGLELLGNITVPRRSHTLAVDPTTHAVWVAYGTPENDYIMKLLPSP